MAEADASSEEVQLLAELQAGLLDGPDREHAVSLAATERGRAALAALARVQSDLAVLPAPELPDEFWTRLPTVADQAALPAGQSRRARGRSRWSRSTPWLVGAAAACLALATTVGAGVLRVGAPGSQAVGAGGGVASDTGSGEAGSGGTGEPDGAAESAGTEAHGGGPAAVPRDEAFAVSGAPLPTLATGRDYGREDLPRAVVELSARAGADGRSGDSAGGAAGSARSRPPRGAPVELARLGEPAALRACLDGLGAGLAVPLVVDFARFEGSAALVVLLAGSPASGTTAYVVGPSCSATDPDLRHVAPS